MKGLTQVAVCPNSVDLKVLREEKLEKYWVPWSQDFCLSNGNGSFIPCVSALARKVRTPLNTPESQASGEAALTLSCLSGRGVTHNLEMRKACLSLDPLRRLGTRIHRLPWTPTVISSCSQQRWRKHCMASRQAIWWAVCAQHCAILVNLRFYHAGSPSPSLIALFFFFF